MVILEMLQVDNNPNCSMIGQGRWPPTLSLFLLEASYSYWGSFFLSTVAKVLLIVGTVGFPYKYVT